MYTCGHADTIVISRCRRTVAKCSRGARLSPPEKWLKLKESGKLRLNFRGLEHPQARIPACRPAPALTLRLGQRCGVCHFRNATAEWNERVEAFERRVAEVRGMWGADEGQLASLEQQLEDLVQQRTIAQWDLRRQSPTEWHETPAKDTHLGPKVNRGSPLRRELQPEDLLEDQISPPCLDAQGVPFSTFWDFFVDRYMWMGPDLNWSESETFSCSVGSSRLHDESFSETTELERLAHLTISGEVFESGR